MPNWGVISKMFDDLSAKLPGTEALEAVTFDYVKDSFARTVEEWRQTAREARDFWAHVNRASKGNE
jgi:hypothetical protein